MFTNQKMNELLAWGEEGVDFVIKDGEACYPEGVDTTTLYHCADYQVANSLIIAPWQGAGADFRQVSADENATAPVSPYMGFTLNTGDLDTVIGTISAVNDEFFPRLNSGYYTEELMNDYLAKLQTAGVDDYIAAAQAQLDAFIAQR
jgi:hypothetical protein